MDTRVAQIIAKIVHMAQLSNIDSETGKCLDVPDTPSVEPEILFPNKLTKIIVPKRDDDNKDSDNVSPSSRKQSSNDSRSDKSPTLNGTKRSYDDTMASTSAKDISVDVGENGNHQINGIHQNGSNHETIIKPPRINGIHKHKQQPPSSSISPNPTSPPRQDVKAILRNSINHKQQESITGPPTPKRARLDVNGTNGLLPSPRMNGATTNNSSSTTSTTNGPTPTSGGTNTNSSSSSMAIVT